MTGVYPVLPAGQPMWVTNGGYGVRIGTGVRLVNDAPEQPADGYPQPSVLVEIEGGRHRMIMRASLVPLLPDEARPEWMRT